MRPGAAFCDLCTACVGRPNVAALPLTAKEAVAGLRAAPFPHPATKDPT